MSSHGFTSLGNVSSTDSGYSWNDFLAQGLGTIPSAEFAQMDALSPQQQELMNQFMIPMLQNRAANFDQLTSLSGLEQQALQGAGEQFGAVFGQGGSAEQGRGAISKAIGNVGANFDAFYQNNIRDVLMQDFTENIRPGTSRKFADSGFFSSDRATADSTDMENLLKTLTRGRSETQLAANQQLGNLATQSVGFEQGLSGLLSQLMTQGGLERNIGGAEFDRLMASFAAALGIETVDNVAVTLPGMTGGMNEVGASFMGGLGSGLGCWVAEDLYGANHDKTIRIRAFILSHMRDLTQLGAFARAYNSGWADQISNHPVLRPVARFIWNRLYKMAKLEQTK